MPGDVATCAAAVAARARSPRTGIESCQVLQPNCVPNASEPLDSAEWIVQSWRGHGAGLMPERAGFVKV